jgi:hypothetical protein
MHIERCMVVVAACIALAGWIELEATTDVAPSLALYGGAFLALSALTPLVHCLSDIGGLGAIVSRLKSIRRADPLIEQCRAWGVSGRSVWLLPVALIPFMLLTLPIAYHTSPGDNSILGVLALYAFGVGSVGLAAGFLTWGMVLLPVLLICRSMMRRLTGGGSDSNDRYALGLAMVLLGIVTFAATLVLSTPDRSGAGSTRPGQRIQLHALLGDTGNHVVHPALLWVARFAVLVVVAGGLVLVRVAGVGRAGSRD